MNDEEHDARIRSLTQALSGLEREVTRVGGFATMELQAALREARGVLEAEGLRTKTRTRTWRNR